MTHVRARRRRLCTGFTLMEVMTALTITALVATVAASALRAGLDVRERVQAHRTTLDAEARAMSWIGNMLRHAPPASAVNEALLSIAHSTTNNGADAITFLSRGVESPLGTGQIWRVNLSATPAGLRIYAVPATANGNRVPLETLLPHVSGLVVEALDANGGPANTSSWRRDWPVLRTMPRAVRLTLALRDGSVREPVVFASAPLSAAGN